ncbi:tRNA dimethylallyltransferase [Collimonas arenae]|uniref:tRNA dimethylallyltransferase n=1 Tax=Collimonas arenae TaxID=279058 RepID=A0A0A1FEM3_9BURK|nr:lipoprotein [Collimonas arenae]AIY42961.1 tRNA dimethylallyltransferase [Collimonas arenae]
MNKLAITLLLVLTAGCSTTTPNYDTKFGDAVREAKLKMIIHPDAGKNPDQVAGMDGKAARESILQYQDTYKTPPPVVNVINIGGSLGGTK